MALLALLPGASTLMGMLIAWPAVQMLLGHDIASLPRAIERRQVRVEQLARAIRVVSPRLQSVERLVRPRWPTAFHTNNRLTGLVMLLLGFSLVPFGHILPALVIMLLALAYLEEDGVALLVALLAAALSLAVTGATLWGVVETIDWIDPKATARPEDPPVFWSESAAPPEQGPAFQASPVEVSPASRDRSAITVSTRTCPRVSSGVSVAR